MLGIAGSRDRLKTLIGIETRFYASFSISASRRDRLKTLIGIETLTGTFN